MSYNLSANAYTGDLSAWDDIWQKYSSLVPRRAVKPITGKWHLRKVFRDDELLPRLPLPYTITITRTYMAAPTAAQI